MPQFKTCPHEIVDHRQAHGAAIARRPAGEQRARIGVARIAEELGGRRLLADLAIAHHHDVVGDLAHQREVVRDEQHRHLVPFLQPGDQVHDLALHRDVERGGRLIGDQQLRLAGDRHRDHHPLLLPARELVRIGVEPRLRLRNADFVQQLDGPLAQRPAREAQVLAQHLADLEADAEHRIERGHRLLEDHRDLGAAQLLHLPPSNREEVAAAVKNPARRTNGRVLGRKEAHDGQRSDRLAAARLADQRHGAAHGYIEADALDRVQRGGLVDAEANGKVADLEQIHFSLGSSASRIASVNRLNAVTSSAMKTVAAVSCHHLPSRSSLPASASMLPQETVSTPTPKPRNVRVTSDLMDSTTCSESCTSTTWLTFGRMCTNMRRAPEAPTASAASTYSRTLCFRYSARTRRKIPVQPVKPRIRITVDTPLRSSTAAIASTSRRYGIDVKTLYSQLRKSSTQPPR